MGSGSVPTDPVMPGLLPCAPHPAFPPLGVTSRSQVPWLGASPPAHRCTITALFISAGAAYLRQLIWVTAFPFQPSAAGGRHRALKQPCHMSHALLRGTRGCDSPSETGPPAALRVPRGAQEGSQHQAGLPVTRAAHGSGLTTASCCLFTASAHIPCTHTPAQVLRPQAAGSGSNAHGPELPLHSSALTSPSPSALLVGRDLP